MRLKERRLEKKVGQAELATKIGTSAPMLSNFENYKCLPVPATLRAICDELDCAVQDIYERSEIYVETRSFSTGFKVNGRQEPSVYKLSVRLPDEARDKLTQENLEKCGYHSLKDFVWHSFQRFVKQLAVITAKENRLERNSKAVLDNGDTSTTA